MYSRHYYYKRIEEDIKVIMKKKDSSNLGIPVYPFVEKDSSKCIKFFGGWLVFAVVHGLMGLFASLSFVNKAFCIVEWECLPL